jgi:probable selenium-dependent hydroxylase accessory protein YqeC
MSMRSPRPLLESFDLEKNRYVYLIGGGGKTALLFVMARALVEGGRSVLTTTSTKILRPTPDESDHVVIGAESSVLIDRVTSGFSSHRHITAALALAEDGQKLLGLSVDQIDLLADAHASDYVLVEADGAAGRSIKAHLDHEPVVSGRADLVVVVIGVDCIGKPMLDLHVHRAELFRRRLGRPLDSVVTVDDVAAIVFHRDGYLKRIAQRSEVVVFVNKVAGPEAEANARRLEQAVKGNDTERRIHRVVLGDVATGRFL